MKSIKNTIIVAIVVVITCINISFAANSITTVKVETANLREKPTQDSKILELLSENQKVEILEKDGDWYKVKALGITGYLRKDLLNIAQEEKKKETKAEEVENKKEEPKTEVPAADANSRKVISTTKLKIVPSINAAEVGELKQDEVVKVLETMNDWVSVESNQNKGWIRKETLSEINAEVKEENKEEIKKEETIPEPEKLLKTMYINSELVNMRKEPNTSSEVLARLSINTKVDVYEEKDTWYKVKVDGKNGYISKTLLGDKVTQNSRSMNTRRTKQVNNAEKQTKSQTQPVRKTPEVASNVVATAKQYLGYSYRYGATGPNAFDCSGFTSYIYRKHGVNLNRTAQGQYSNGRHVSRNELQPGDLVMFGRSASSINHVAIYAGNGQIVHAANSSRGVTIDSINSGYYNRNYVGARRVK